MRRILIATLSVTLLTAAVWTVRGAATGSTALPTRTEEAATPAQAAAVHQHPMSARSAGNSQELATQLAKARLATAKYATSLRTAKAAGYQIITRMMPDMGYHYLNPAIQGFDVTKPHILVYERHRASWQLGALEWVFTAKPATPPLPGATYGSFGAACHYNDGTFVLTASQADCAERNRQTGAAFTFWHPDLVTLHVWLWYPNPAGIYNGTNPYVQPFNAG